MVKTRFEWLWGAPALLATRQPPVAAGLLVRRCQLDQLVADHKSSFRARWKDGELDVKIDEEPDDD